MADSLVVVLDGVVVVVDDIIVVVTAAAVRITRVFCIGVEHLGYAAKYGAIAPFVLRIAGHDHTVQKKTNKKKTDITHSKSARFCSFPNSSLFHFKLIGLWLRFVNSFVFMAFLCCVGGIH